MLLSCDFLKRVLEREGGYVDHPDDRGGPTNHGITLETLARFRRRTVSKEDIQELSETEAIDIYSTLYWIGPKFNTLALRMDCAELLFDAAVNHGTGWAIRALQKIVGVTVDGIIGPVTRRAVGLENPNFLFRDLLIARLELYATIVSNDSSQAVFMKGWMNRMKQFMLMMK